MLTPFIICLLLFFIFRNFKNEDLNKIILHFKYLIKKDDEKFNFRELIIPILIFFVFYLGFKVDSPVNIIFIFGLIFTLMIFIAYQNFIQLKNDPEKAKLLKPLEQIKEQYRNDMSKRKAIKLDYKPLFFLLILSILQFYHFYADNKSSIGIGLYSVVIFCVNLFRFVPELYLKNKFGAVIFACVLSIPIFYIYIHNPINELLYLIFFSYLTLIYHILFASNFEIEKQTFRGGCMIFFYVVLFIIFINIKISSDFMEHLSNYNKFYLFNGLYFLFNLWLEYSTQKMLKD